MSFSAADVRRYMDMPEGSHPLAPGGVLHYLVLEDLRRLMVRDPLITPTLIRKKMTMRDDRTEPEPEPEP